MDRSQIETLLSEVSAGSTSVAAALERLRNLPFEDLGFAKLDHHRALRTGMPEVIFAESKTPAQVATIFARMANAGGNVLATRASREVYDAVRGVESRAEFNAPLRFALAQHDSWPPGSAIVFHRFHPDLWTISYFNPQAAWMGLERADLGEMERDLAYARSQSKPLWVEETAYELVAGTTQGRKWLMDHERRDELVRFQDAKHEFVFHSIR